MRKLVEAKSKHHQEESDPGVLAASGLVAGEGLAGVAVAGMVAFGVIPKGKTAIIDGTLGVSLTLISIGLLCYFLYRGGVSKKS